MISDAAAVSARIFVILTQEGALLASKHPEEYTAYRTDPDIRDLLNHMVSEESVNGILVDTPSSNAVYLVPSIYSPLVYNRISFKKRYLSTVTQTIDCYIELVMMLFILHGFYGGKNANIQQRSFMTYSDIIELMDANCNAILSTEKKREESESTGISFLDVAKSWKGYVMGDEVLHTRGRQAKKGTKYGKMLHVISVLEDEKLVRNFPDSEQIYPSERLDNLMRSYYLTLENVELLNNWITELEGAKNAET